MAYWDAEQSKKVYFPPHPSKEWPGWEEVDCGCCGGLQWGSGYDGGPSECNACAGLGYYFRHIASGALAQYPGGPFLGREPAALKEDMA